MIDHYYPPLLERRFYAPTHLVLVFVSTLLQRATSFCTFLFETRHHHGQLIMTSTA